MLHAVLLFYDFVARSIHMLFTRQVEFFEGQYISYGSIYILIFLLACVIYLIKTLTNKSVVSSKKGS